MKKVKIPVLNVRELIHMNNDDTVDCFYGVDSENEKTKAIELIRGEMSKYNSFVINYDFMVNTKFAKREWSFDNNVMIYENRETTDDNRILCGGKGSYECVLWMSANAT